MSPDEAKVLRDRAAARALKRIRADRRGAPLRIARLLDQAEADLFKKELNVDHLMRQAGIRDRAIASRFRRHVGQAPLAYLVERRVEVARELLLESGLPVWQVASLVGFASPQVFIRSFRKVEGCSPGEFRKEGQKRQSTSVSESVDEVVTLQTCSRATSGRVQAHQARSLIERLWRSCFRLWSSWSKLGSHGAMADLSEAALDRVRATGALRALEGLAPEEQRGVVRSDLGFRSPVLFELLREESRSEGRHDRRRGIELAELALDSLEPLQGVLEAPRLDELIALGWAWLGTTKRLALDFPGADAAFSAANLMLPSTIEDRRARAEIACMECWLRLFQRRPDDAHKIATSMLHLLDQHAMLNSVGELRLVRALASFELQRPREAVPDLLVAIEVLEGGSDKYFLASAYQSLALSYVKLGIMDEAEAILPKALELAPHLSSPVARLHLTWSEGVLEQAKENYGRAEELYRTARQGLLERSEIFDAAIVGVQLAGLYAFQGSWARLRELLLEILQVFRSYRVHREAVVSLCLLQEALDNERVTTAVLDEARASLEQLKARVADGSSSDQP